MQHVFHESVVHRGLDIAFETQRDAQLCCGRDADWKQ